MRHLLLSLLLLPSLALADPYAEQDYLALYAGYFDVTQDDGNNALQLGLDYRFEPVYEGLRPAAGVNVTSDGAMYGYSGFFWDVFLTDQWLLTPNFVAGLYGRGDGKDLGSGVEFRSGIELSYQFETGQRAGLQFNHISNAGIGDSNIGAESLLLVFQQPVKW